MVAGKTSHVEVEEAAPDPPAPSSSAREAFHLVVIVQISSPVALHAPKRPLKPTPTGVA